MCGCSARYCAKAPKSQPAGTARAARRGARFGGRAGAAVHSVGAPASASAAKRVTSMTARFETAITSDSHSLQSRRMRRLLAGRKRFRLLAQPAGAPHTMLVRRNLPARPSLL